MSSRYRIHGILLSCKHCGSGGFTRHTARDRRGGNLGAVGLELDDGSETEVFSCATCGFIHWFVPMDLTEELPDETPCLECGAVIPGETNACPSCGWSWSRAS